MRNRDFLSDNNEDDENYVYIDGDDDGDNIGKNNNNKDNHEQDNHNNDDHNKNNCNQDNHFFIYFGGFTIIRTLLGVSHMRNFLWQDFGWDLLEFKGSS